ncbi:hypothetical protein SAMN05720487_10110 [Fibrobacter sp. UWT2]|nr:hypothetical protein SAMN05720487_10110 [Fibrobacter sp. UWT2]
MTNKLDFSTFSPYEYCFLCLYEVVAEECR